MSRSPSVSTSSFSPFRHRDFRLFWTSAFISNSAHWMQQITVPFIVFQMTDSNTWLGAVAFAALVPGLFMTPLAGVIADKVPRRLVLMSTLSVMTVVATLYLILWVNDELTPWRILLLALVQGFAAGLQVANWQSFVPLLVPRSDLLAAVRLNSIQFTASRAIGPVVGAILLSLIGPGAVFFGNAITYVLLVITVGMVRPRETPSAPGETLREVFRDGVIYVRRRRSLLQAVATAFAISLLGQSLVQLAAGLAGDQYDVGVLGLAGLITATGFGSVGAAAFAVVYGDRIPRSTVAMRGLLVYAAGPIIAGMTTFYAFGLAGYFFLGAAHLTVAIALNTSIQIQVSEDVRGRVMSIYLLGIFAGQPIGAFVGGRLGDVLGLRFVYISYGLLLLVYALVIARLRFNGLKALDANHDILEEPTPS
jgi:MFS family permease